MNPDQQAPAAANEPGPEAAAASSAANDEDSEAPAADRRYVISHLWYDEYVLLGNNPEKAYDDSIPLAQVISGQFMVDTYGHLDMEDGLLMLPGETDTTITYDVPSEFSKKICRSMLKALWRNWKNGLCFADFDDENIMVSPTGKVRFRNVAILRGLSPEQLAEQIRCNYRCAHYVIGHVVYSCKAPPEIRHLLYLIVKDHGAYELFHNHASLLPVISYSGMFKELYDLIKFVYRKDQFRDLLLQLPERYFLDPPNLNIPYWMDVVSKNLVLDRTLTHKPNSYDVPGDKPNQTCLNFEQKSLIRDLGLSWVGQRSLSADQIRLIKRLRFLDYFRNRNAQRLEPLQWWIGQNQPPFNAHGSELIVHVGFPVLLSELQYEVYKDGRLSEIRIEKLF